MPTTPQQQMIGQQRKVIHRRASPTSISKRQSTLTQIDFVRRRAPDRREAAFIESDDEDYAEERPKKKPKHGHIKIDGKDPLQTSLTQTWSACQTGRSDYVDISEPEAAAEDDRDPRDTPSAELEGAAALQARRPDIESIHDEARALGDRKPSHLHSRTTTNSAEHDCDSSAFGLDNNTARLTHVDFPTQSVRPMRSLRRKSLSPKPVKCTDENADTYSAIDQEALLDQTSTEKNRHTATCPPPTAFNKLRCASQSPARPKVELSLPPENSCGHLFPPSDSTLVREESLKETQTQLAYSYDPALAALERDAMRFGKLEGGAEGSSQKCVRHEGGPNDHVPAREQFMAPDVVATSNPYQGIAPVAQTQGNDTKVNLGDFSLPPPPSLRPLQIER